MGELNSKEAGAKDKDAGEKEKRRGQQVPDNGRRRARTAGAETKDLVPLSEYETAATKGKNPTVKEPKAIRILGMRFLDSSIAECTACASVFTTTNRRHWCRRCGRIFCDPCSAKRQILYTGGPPLRVCRPCAAPLLFKLPINLLQHIFSYHSLPTLSASIRTCHRFQLGINLLYKEVRNIHDIYDKGMTKYVQKGAFGCVYSAQHQVTKEAVAIKVIDKYKVYSLREWNFIKREISLHEGIKHGNIVELKRVCQTRSKVYIVMELGGGDLFDYMMAKGFMTEEEVVSIATQLLNALDYLHTVMRVVHRDVKPENILIFGKDEGPVTVKLCDFGLAKEFSGDDAGPLSCTPCGTLNYCPPEVLAKNTSTTASRLCKLDIFSLGTVLHVMISGQEPFKGKTPAELLKAMKKGFEFKGAEWEQVTPVMKDIVAAMLSFDSTTRPTASGALTKLAAVAVGVMKVPMLTSPVTTMATTPAECSLGTMPLLQRDTYKERIAQSVKNDYEFRLEEDAMRGMKVDQVKKSLRTRGVDVPIPV